MGSQSDSLTQSSVEPTSDVRALPECLFCDKPGCNYAAISAKTLRNHVSREHPKPRRCCFCKHVAPSLKQLRKHLRDEHPQEKDVRCDQCSYRGTSKMALLLHRGAAHGRRENQKIACRETCVVGGLEVPCRETFKILSRLRAHLADEHGISEARDEVTEQFATLDDFETWKSAYEQATSAEYVSRTSSLRQCRRALFWCSRSGTYRPRGCGLRRLKSQGSKKLGFRCTAVIGAAMSPDGGVTATVFPFHYGHGTDLADVPHRRIPQATRDDIKGRLLRGDGLSTIVRDIRKKCELEDDDPSTNRSYWLTRHDLLNICQELNITPRDTRADKKRTDDLLVVALPDGDDDGSARRQEDDTVPVARSRRQLWRQPSGRARDIRRRHQAAARLLSAGTAAAAPLAGARPPAWRLRPAAAGQPVVVERLRRACPAAPGCELRCEECDLCAHQFACECADWAAHQLPCEHVHALRLLGVPLDGSTTEEGGAEAGGDLLLDGEGRGSPVVVEGCGTHEPSPPPSLTPTLVPRPTAVAARAPPTPTPTATAVGTDGRISPSGRSASPTEVARQLRELAALAPELSPSVCRQIGGHLSQIRRLVGREGDRLGVTAPSAGPRPRSAPVGLGPQTLCVLRRDDAISPVAAAALRRMQRALSARTAAWDPAEHEGRQEKRPRTPDDALC